MALSNAPTALPTIDIDGDTVLGTVSAAAEVPFSDDTAILSLAVTVTADSRWSTRRCFDGRLTLKLDGAEHYAGQITGFHVLKPSKAQPDRDARAWVDQWLAGRASSFEDGEAEMMFALRALYKRSGSPRPAGQEARGLDHTDDMVFLQKIYILQQDAKTGLRFAGRGLLRHALSLFHRCLTAPDSTTAPAECRLAGAVTLFLEPGLIDDDEQSAMWDHLRPRAERPTAAEENAFCERVAAQLEAIYTRPSIGFDVRVRDHAIAGERHTVLARRFDAPAPPAAARRSPPSSPAAARRSTASSGSSSRRSSTKTLSSPTPPRSSPSIGPSPPSPSPSLSHSHSPPTRKRKHEPEVRNSEEDFEEKGDEEDDEWEADEADDDDYKEPRPPKRRKRGKRES